MTVIHRSARLLLVVTVAWTNACVTVTTPVFLQPAPERDWKPTLEYARQLSAAGHYVPADSVLAAYAAMYPADRRAIETNYWRALFQLQSPAGTREAGRVIPMLQAYLAAGPTTEHPLEADALLRAAARVDTLARAAMTLTSHGEVTIDPAPGTAARTEPKPEIRSDPKDLDEIKRLKDELARSKDELDRIKKRLAEPPKKPPM